jgi:hypothetical protein
MSAATLLVILLVGVIAGWLAGQVVKGTGFSLVADIAIGIVGALSWLLPRLGIHLGSRYYRRNYWRNHSAAHPDISLPKEKVVTDIWASHVPDAPNLGSWQ